MAGKRTQHPRLSREPQDITKEAWYYEQDGGIHVVIRDYDRQGRFVVSCLSVEIPWSKLITSVNRYKSRRASLNKRAANKGGKGK